MILAPNPFRFVSPCLESLSGGRAPDYWSRDLAEKTRWVSATIQSCDWLEELVDIDLRVSRCPLYGHGLAALATREAINAPASESASSRPHVNQSADEVRRRLAKSNTSIAARDPFDASSKDPNSSASTSRNTRSPCLTEPVLQLQPQADISLLRRHAGQNESSGVNAESRTVKSKTEPPNPDRVRLPADLRRAAIPNSLLARASRRAEAAWFVAARERHGFDRFTIDNQTQSSNSPSFAEHWSRSVAGVCASAELLTLLASSEAVVDRTFERVEKSETSGLAAGPTTSALGNIPQLLGPQLGGSSSAHNRYEEAERPAEPPKPSPSFTGVESPSQDLVVDTPSLPPSQSWPQTVERNKERPADARFAPPSLMPSLVALRPPSAPNADLPVAAVINQGGAKSEQRWSQEDDLVLLAAKLERLLSQEARRHGIDV